MESKIRLSIIVAGYGHPELWQNCLASLRASSCCAAEIICVDDGSNDVCVKTLLEEYSAADKRFVPVFKKNGGVCTARNVALDIARGEYVAFVDYDDCCYIDTLLSACEFLDSNPICTICTFGVRIFWDGLEIECESVPECSFVLCGTGPELFFGVHNRLYKKQLFNYVWNKVYRKDFINRNNIRFVPHAVCFEDVIFNIDCLMAGAVMGAIPKLGYVWIRKFDGSTLSWYRPWIEEGLALAVRSRKQWVRFTGVEKDAVASKWVESLEKSSAVMVIKNLYLPGAGNNLRYRLKKICELLGCGVVFGLFVEIKYRTISFLRRHFYITSIRRRHILHVFPNARIVSK